MAQLAECPTLGFGSGHDLVGCESEPRMRLWLEPTWDSVSPSLSASAPAPLVLCLFLSLSLKNKLKILEKKEENSSEFISFGRCLLRGCN